MNVLVTGSAGFVGRNLVENLKTIRDGKNRTRPNIHIDHIYEYDMENTPEQLDAFCADCDFVFNLAGVNRPKDPADFKAGNYGSASMLLDTLKKHGNKCPVMLSSSLQATFKALTGLSCRDVIMVLPEANSANGISSDWWSKLLENLPQDKLLTNITHIENFPEFQKIPNIELSLEEVTALALHCRQVYAVRSGLCDLIFSKGSDLHVFYPTRNIYSVFGLYDMFAFPGIHETVYEADFDEYVHIGVLPQQKTKLGFGKWLFCSKIRRYSFFGINFFSMVEK